MFLTAIALSGAFLPLVAGYVLLQLASNTAQGPYQGLLPDLVPEAQKGTASGYYGASNLVGTLLGLVTAVTMSVWLVSLFAAPILPGFRGITEPIVRKVRPMIHLPSHSERMKQYATFYDLYLNGRQTPGAVLQAHPELKPLWTDQPARQYGRPAAFYWQLQSLNLARAWSAVTVCVPAANAARSALSA